MHRFLAHRLPQLAPLWCRLLLGLLLIAGVLAANGSAHAAENAGIDTDGGTLAWTTAELLVVEPGQAAAWQGHSCQHQRTPSPQLADLLVGESAEAVDWPLVKPVRPRPSKHPATLLMLGRSQVEAWPLLRPPA